MRPFSNVCVSCRVASPFVMCQSPESAKHTTDMLALHSSLPMWVSVLLADSNRRSRLFGISSAGKCQEEHPSTGCHGDGGLGVQVLGVVGRSPR